ncbi:MAG: hypothetical protein KDA96_12435 [Planctomycetaceae bacterium]|nr:hypothetical protein [Planctomycetaceae bacterium]
MNPFEEQQRRFNEQTACCHGDYTNHRQRVTAEIQRAIATWRGQGREQDQRRPAAMVIGAGNCNDLDLPAMVPLVSTLHLVDLDAQAVNNAVQRDAERLGADGASRIRIAAPLDFAAPLFQAAGELAEKSVQEIMEMIRSNPNATTLPKVDVVVSLCVLSQMTDTLASGLRLSKEGEDSIHAREQFPAFHALVAEHLLRLQQLKTPNGISLLVTDIVSSDTEPRLLNCTDSDLPRLLQQCLQRGNFFLGLHPGRLAQSTTAAAAACGRSEHISVSPPWIWKMQNRRYAVCAIHSGPAPQPN